MTIKKLIFLFILIAVPLSVIITLSAVFLKRTQSQVEQAQNNRYASYAFASELLNSSEQLTRFARTYVVTGNPVYRKYFQQVLDMRSGKLPAPDGYNEVYWHLVSDSLKAVPVSGRDGVSLEQKLLDVGITLKEFGLFKDAENLSNTLAKLEDEAMADILKSQETGIKPAVAASLRQRAIDLLHGKEYHRAKAAIMLPIGNFIGMMDLRTRNELNEHNHQARMLLILLISSAAAMLLVFLSFAYLIYSRLMRRGDVLLKNIGMMAGGDLTVRNNDPSGDELGSISAAIDDMADRLSAALEQARLKTKEAEERAVELDIQRNHSEKLINNMLPVLIADRLKKGESGIAETFPEVTVLFADIVGFTKMAEQTAPRVLVNMLNEIFGRFDELAMECRLEKIKTIGDCYMVVGGVPERSSTHCQQVAEFALAAVESITAYGKENNMNLQMRIGIHTGTVVAGIVGKQKYSYDLWGDVVNTASRMETSSLPGKIHVTEAVRVRLMDDYEIEDRGMVELKGKGPVHGFFLGQRKSDRN